MTAQQWRDHIIFKYGRIDKQIVENHILNNPDCEVCKARRKTRKASLAKKIREDAYRSCGLKKVIGSVSGSTYWE